MANVRNGNTFYIDTQYSTAADELAIKGVRVPYIMFSSSATTNRLVLADSVTGITKISLINLTGTSVSGDTRLFDFRENPVLFPNGIRPLTVTNCLVTCLIIDPRG